MKQWYYAKNGQKLGPFQKSHVLELYRKGEISPSDLVWEEGMPEWVPAGKALTAAPVVEATPAAAPVGGGKLNPMECIGKAWDLTWKYPAYLIGGMVTVVAISMIAGIPGNIGSFLQLMYKETPESPLYIVGLSIYIVGALFSGIICAMIQSGLLWMFLKIIRGKTPDYGDLFVAFKEPKLAVTLVLVNLVATLAILLGFVALIIPGIYLSVAFAFVLIVAIDRRTGVFEALGFSRKIVAGQWWRVFALFLLNGVIAILGMLACLVGLLIAIPICVAANMYAYETLLSSKKD